jgi:hypothetical protein
MKRSNRICVAELPRNIPSRNTGKRSALSMQASSADLVSLLASQGSRFSTALSLFILVFSLSLSTSNVNFVALRHESIFNRTAIFSFIVLCHCSQYSYKGMRHRAQQMSENKHSPVQTSGRRGHEARLPLRCLRLKGGLPSSHYHCRSMGTNTTSLYPYAHDLEIGEQHINVIQQELHLHTTSPSSVGGPLKGKALLEYSTQQLPVLIHQPYGRTSVSNRSRGHS